MPTETLEGSTLQFTASERTSLKDEAAQRFVIWVHSLVVSAAQNGERIDHQRLFRNPVLKKEIAVVSGLGTLTLVEINEAIDRGWKSGNLEVERRVKAERPTDPS